MKKIINILLFLSICLGAKALGSKSTFIYTYGAHHMKITTSFGKEFTFEDQAIEFSAYNGTHDNGGISLVIYDESPEAYKKLKQMMDEIQAKIKVIPVSDDDVWKKGIKHYSPKINAKHKWVGYQGSLIFQFEDIERIYLF